MHHDSCFVFGFIRQFHISQCNILDEMHQLDHLTHFVILYDDVKLQI